MGLGPGLGTRPRDRDSDAGVCEKQHSFCASLCFAIQQQRLLSSPRFGALKAYAPEGLLIRRNVLFTDTGRDGDRDGDRKGCDGAG